MDQSVLAGLRKAAEAYFERDRALLVAKQRQRHAIDRAIKVEAGAAAKEISAQTAHPELSGALTAFLQASAKRRATLQARGAECALEEEGCRQAAASSFRKVEAVRFLAIRAAAERRKKLEKREDAAIEALTMLKQRVGQA